MPLRVRIIPVILRTLLCISLSCLTLRGALAEVAINGLGSDAEKNVQLTLSLVKEACDAPAWKIRGLYRKADAEIDEGLRALGYYHSKIKKSLAFNSGCWRADFTIDAGPRVIVADVAITLTGDAKDDQEFQKLRRTLVAQTGQPLRHDDYEKLKSRIESFALERGYLKGSFAEKQLLIDKDNNQAHIKLAFDAGQRMRFGEVSVDQDILKPEFVRKFIAIRSDDYYASAPLTKTHNALSKSGYFEMIDIRPGTEHIEQQKVPVKIKLYPKKRHHYGFGVGFDTDIGPLLNAAFYNRRLNRRGHFLTANLDLSPVLSTADVEYSIPLSNPLSDFFSFGGGLKREHTDTYRSLSAKLSARLKHAFDNGWKQTLYIDSIYEDFTAGDTSNSVLLLVPGGSWLRSVADSTLRPKRGHRLELNLSGSYKNPISDVSFAQGYLAAVWMQPVFSKGKFIARSELGATLVDQFERLPTSFRFYAGGMNSIRGYSYKELGPKDAQGNVAGGKFLSLLSAEYEHAILENWGVAAFIDSGNAFNMDDFGVKTGAGLGVRWYSPIGPIRVDFAIPLSDSNSSFQIHFAAGTRL